MKLNTTPLGKQLQRYVAPEIVTVEIVASSVLCNSSQNSTEELVEDNFNPWA